MQIRNDDEKLHLVASFILKNGIIFLEGASHQVLAYVNQKIIEYFISARVLNHCQAYLNMSLCHFHFAITCQLGKQQGLSNVLS